MSETNTTETTAVTTENTETIAIKSTVDPMPPPKEFIAEQPPAEEEPPLFRYPDPVLFTPNPEYGISGHKWKIKGLRTASNGAVNNGVVEVYWEITGTDQNGFEGKYNGSTQFNLSSSDSSNFTSYENLKEEQIMGWIKGSINERFMDHINGQIALDIQMKKSSINMESQTSLPWNTK